MMRYARAEPGLRRAGRADDVTELARAVATAFANLKPPDQEILRLAAWEQLSSSEGAAVLQCSVPAYRMRLHRARIRLAVASGARELLRPQPHDPPAPAPAPARSLGRENPSLPARSWSCDRSDGSGLFGPDPARSAPGRRSPGSRRRRRPTLSTQTRRRASPASSPRHAPVRWPRRPPGGRRSGTGNPPRAGPLRGHRARGLGGRRRGHHTAVGFTVGGSTAGSGHQRAGADQPGAFPCTDMTSPTDDLTPARPSGPRHRAASPRNAHWLRELLIVVVVAVASPCSCASSSCRPSPSRRARWSPPWTSATGLWSTN